MPALQAMAAIACAPIGPPVSRPRTVWVTGVKGSYSANCRSPTGMLAVGTNPLDRNGSKVRNIGVLLAVSTLFAARPSAADSQMRPNANSEGLQHAADHMAGEHGATGDGHGAEPVDDASGHVGGDGDRGAEGGRCHGDDQDAGDDIGEVHTATACAGPAEAVAELAAQDVHEQQQEHDREACEHERQRRVAELVLEVASQHRRRVGEGIGEGGHGKRASSSWRVARSAVALPVTAKKTSSRSGVWIDRFTTVMLASSSSLRTRRTAATLPSPGTCRIS